MNKKGVKWHFILVIGISVILSLSGCHTQGEDFLIGVSQCSDDDWRTQLNKEILREAQFYPGVKVEIRAAKDDNARQIRDIEELIGMGIDLLIVSPNVVDDVSPAIEKAYQKGIPVILVDRRTRSEQCTAFVGADNYDIGRRAGNYIANRLEGQGKIIEIRGLVASTPDTERHRGLKDALHDYPHIETIDSIDAGWFEAKAEQMFDSLLALHPHIDLVFCYNDRMAAGAYRAAVRRKREKEMLFIGIDALYGEGKGVDMVSKGQLDATFIYPTGGDKVMEVAMNILQGKAYAKENILSTALVNKANARIMQMQTQQINTLDGKIETLNDRIDVFLTRYSAQRMLLYACILIIALTIGLLVMAVRAFWTKVRLNNELSLQKKQLEEQRDQLIELSKQLEEATYAKLAFFTNVSHDFRTPLTLIADPVEQLNQSTHLDEHERFLLNIVHKNVSVLLRLVNQILDFRKYEAGKLNLHLSQFDLAAALREWTDAFHTLAYRKNIRFGLHTPDETDGPHVVTADAEKMERIVYNLLSNAFKFTPEAGSVQVDLSFFTQDNHPWLRLQVTDTGAGMPAEHVQHIFENFYQIDVHHAGSGIGLALVKAFVEMHHGDIRVESTEGKGTTFTIEMPAARQDVPSDASAPRTALPPMKEGALAEATQGTAQAQAPTMEDDGRETILIVDDNRDIRDYVRSVLEGQYHVIEAADGKEGLSLAMKYVPDAIICDVMMPVMDGMECCRRLKSELQTSHIPVVMLTAYAMDEQKIKGYECGADSYIAKPFSAALLTTRLRNLIDNRHRLQQAFSNGTLNTERKTPLKEMDKGFLDKLQTLIDQHLSEPELSVEQLGDAIGLSRVQLYRKTKALSGYSPNELVRIARLKRASSLLASTEKTIAEITYEVGFTSPSYFAKCYKDYFGESPTDFLKRKKGDGA